MVVTSSIFASFSVGGQRDLAVDSSNILYATSVIGTNKIVKITSNGTVNDFVTSGLNGAAGLAFDSIGNLYCANYNGNNIVKITPLGVVSTFVTGISNPLSIIFDSLDNLYCSRGGTGIVLKITQDGTITTLANGGLLSEVRGIAVDSSDNLYVANNVSKTISKIILTGPFAGNVSNFASTGVGQPSDIAIDTLGNLYVTCSNINSIVKITAAGSVSNYASGTPILSPYGIAIDSLNSVYTINISNPNVIVTRNISEPTIGPLNVESPKTVGDIPYVLTNPISNSSGTFSYTSSDTSVATVTGNTITIVGNGTTIITTTQAATSSFTSGSTNTTLVVNASTPENPTGIQSGYELFYFMDTQASYASIINNITITEPLIAETPKTLTTDSNYKIILNLT